MTQLGKGYTYVGSEYKIVINDTYNYLDFLLFNTKFNCYIVLELKVTKLKKEHIGQIEVYMNYIDNHVKEDFHNKTIGLIIVKEGNDLILKYASDSRIQLRKYELV